MGTDGADVSAVEAEAIVQQMTNGYWLTQIVFVAAKLGLADLVAGRPLRVGELAEATQTDPPSLRRLMRALCGLGLFREDPAGGYEATTLGRCLAADSPGALRARAILNGEEWYTAWGGLLDSVRTGGTAFDRIFGAPFFEHIGGHPEVAASFNEAMASSTRRVARAVTDACDLSDCRTIVDVGGGNGAFLAEVLAANPRAHGVVFDRPTVTPAAETFLAEARLSGRCTVVGGDFFEQVPPGGDVYVLSWIIHDWDDERSVTILTNCRRVMSPSARLLLVEQVVPPGNEPSLAKLYDLHMLVLSGGRERDETEYRALLDAAGLELTRVVATASPRAVIEARPR